MTRSGVQDGMQSSTVKTFLVSVKCNNLNVIEPHVVVKRDRISTFGVEFYALL